MEENVFDLRVESRFKNAILYRRLHEEYGAAAYQLRKEKANGFGTLPVYQLAADEIGVSVQLIRETLGLRLSPWGRHGCKEWAQKIADALGMTPEALFPRTLYKLTLPRVAVHEFESAHVVSLQEAARVVSLPSMQEVKLLESEQSRLVKQGIETLLSCLKGHHYREVIQKLYLEDASLEEVGTYFGVTRERVRQVREKAIGQMRSHMRRLPEDEKDAICSMLGWTREEID